MSEKPCMKCGAVLPLSEFYRHPAMGDGHLNKCKACTRLDATKNRAARAEYYRQFDRMRSRKPERASQLSAKNRRRRERFPQMARANSRLARAVKCGLVAKPFGCERCGAGPVQAHHDDHLLPLAVMWLCPVCHTARHKELGRLTGARAF